MKLAISFGGYYADVDKYVEAARYCDERGLDSMWLADSQMIHRDVYECLALCARETKKMRLGTGVTNPITRNVTVTASAITTLNEISNGRAVLGIGPGDSSVRRIGMNPASVAKLESSIQSLRRICRGESITFENGEKVSMRWARGEVPIFVSATGEKMLELAGRVGDGAIINVGASDAALNYAILQVKKGLSTRSDSKQFTVADLSFINIAEHRNDAIRSAKPYVVWYWKNAPRLFQINKIEEDAFKKSLESTEKAYVEHDHIHTDDWSEALARSSFIPDEMVRKFAIAGTPEDCIKQLRSKESLGVDLFIARHTGDQSEWETFLRSYAENVLPSFSGLE